MEKKKSIKLACLLSMAMGLTACGLDIPKEVPSSYETMTVEKTFTTRRRMQGSLRFSL